MTQRKLKWESVAKDPATMPTRELKAVIANNRIYLEMIVLKDWSSERWGRLTAELKPYITELEKRGG